MTQKQYQKFIDLNNDLQEKASWFVNKHTLNKGLNDGDFVSFTSDGDVEYRHNMSCRCHPDWCHALILAAEFLEYLNQNP